MNVHARTTPRPPTVGILGGGQLGRMLALAAARLGVSARFYEPQETGPSVGVGERFLGEWDDEPRLRAFLEGCDVVTLDNEWVELDSVAELLPAGVKLWPSRETLLKVSNKLVQKRHAVAHEIPVGAFRECRTWDEVQASAHEFGFPIVVKRLRHGYDGYGTGTAHNLEELRTSYVRMAQDGAVLVEAWVPYVRELSAVMARRPDGKDIVYPIALTRQQDHRCAAVEVPAPITEDVARRASALARATAEAFDVVGVMAIELFELANGELLFNELAPRPHNSGHYTIDACVTSQFENHLRAILDWPLGDVALLRPASVMVNVLGNRTGIAAADPSLALEVPGAFVHVYGKRDVKPLRKMGHVTTIGEDLDEVRERAHRAAEMVNP